METKKRTPKRRRGPRRLRRAWFALGLFALAVGLSFIWEGPRMVYTHAVIVCLDCIGLI